MRVEVYRNLSPQYRKGPAVWSVRACQGPNRGRVIHRASHVQIKDAQFVVQPGGRARAVREQKRNVHALVRGTFVETPGPSPTDKHRVRYNPYRADHFATEEGEPIEQASLVEFDGKGCWAQLDS